MASTHLLRPHQAVELELGLDQFGDQAVLPSVMGRGLLSGALYEDLPVTESPKGPLVESPVRVEVKVDGT